jgi:hypothetical protein
MGTKEFIGYVQKEDHESTESAEGRFKSICGEGIR